MRATGASATDVGRASALRRAFLHPPATRSRPRAGLAVSRAALLQRSRMALPHRALRSAASARLRRWRRYRLGVGRPVKTAFRADFLSRAIHWVARFADAARAWPDFGCPDGPPGRGALKGARAGQGFAWKEALRDGPAASSLGMRSKELRERRPGLDTGLFVPAHFSQGTLTFARADGGSRGGREGEQHV